MFEIKVTTLFEYILYMFILHPHWYCHYGQSHSNWRKEMCSRQANAIAMNLNHVWLREYRVIY